MSLQLQYEKNSMRKSHRIQFPLKVYIQNSIHDVLDWSMTGLSINTKDNSFIPNYAIGYYKGVLMLCNRDFHKKCRFTLLVTQIFYGKSIL